MSLIGAVAQQGNRVAAYKAINCYYAAEEKNWTRGDGTATTVYVGTPATTTIAQAYSNSAIIYTDSSGTTIATSGYYGDTVGGDGSTASVWDNGTSAWTSQTTYGYTLTVFSAIDGANYCEFGASPTNIYTETYTANMEEAFTGNKRIFADIQCTTDADTGAYGDNSGGAGSGMNFFWDHAWGAPTNCGA